MYRTAFHVVAACAAIFLSVEPTSAQNAAVAPEAMMMRLIIQVDFDKDTGQNFGTLFEAVDAQGRVVAGAGFPGLYNTTCRNDRRSLQFYVRPAQDTGRMVPEMLPRFSGDTGVYIGDINGRMYAMGQRVATRVQAWDDAAGRWEVAPEYANAALRNGDGIMHLGDGQLSFRNSRIEYNGQLVLAASEKESLHHAYYAQGHLFFFHDRPGKTKDGAFTRVCALPWVPDQAAPPDLATAICEPTYSLHETTWAWGQLCAKVITVTNWGTVLVFDGEHWTTLRKHDGKSYQVYSMLNYYDRLLLGHYPSGCLFEYDGQTVKATENWPPRIPGVTGYAREAQATALYRGDLYATVWPWAELWRYDRNAGQWLAVGRMFTRPPVTDKVGHPFEAEIVAYNALHGTKNVINDWGQRATSLAVADGALYVGTSNKGGSPRPVDYTFIDDAALEEYGRVWRLRLPGHLSAQVRWVNGPTTFEFVVTAGEMRLLQDGLVLDSTVLDATLASGVRGAKFTLGEGLFGRLAGLAKVLPMP
ncbi:MAG: hypothetical protein GXY83_41925 [Rhodopirellula sp.]|nr:hypothetical protein [Rhodopirellula sp.]